MCAFCRKENFFFFLCFQSLQRELSLFLFYDWPKKWRILFACFLSPRLCIVFPFYFSGLSPPVLLSVVFKVSSIATCFAVLTNHWIAWNHLLVTHLRVSKMFSSLSLLSFFWSYSLKHSALYRIVLSHCTPSHFTCGSIYAHCVLWYTVKFKVVCGNTVSVGMCMPCVMVHCTWHTVLTYVSAC
jgi:hypothetical protein